MVRVISTVIAGLMIGGILSVAQWASPSLLPWVVGFMIACLASNVRQLA